MLKGCAGTAGCIVGNRLLQLQTPSVNVQLVRWTKPRWVPRAKSKMFLIRRRPDLPSDENEEIRRLFRNYKTSMNSIRRYIEAQYAANVTSDEVLERHAREEEEDWQQRMELNRQWNETIAMKRQEKLAALYEEENKRILEEVGRGQIEYEQKVAEIDGIIRREKELSKSYITAENIDEEIEKCLNNIESMNYAIDLQGNRYYGNEPIAEYDGNAGKQDIPIPEDVSTPAKQVKGWL